MTTETLADSILCTRMRDLIMTEIDRNRQIVYDLNANRPKQAYLRETWGQQLNTANVAISRGKELLELSDNVLLITVCKWALS